MVLKLPLLQRLRWWLADRILGAEKPWWKGGHCAYRPIRRKTPDG